MTGLLIWLGSAAVAGGVSGFLLGVRQLPRMISKMSEAELDDLATRVERLRYGTR